MGFAKESKDLENMGDNGVHQVSFAPANAELENDISALVDLDDLFAGKCPFLCLKTSPSPSTVSYLSLTFSMTPRFAPLSSTLFSS